MGIRPRVGMSCSPEFGWFGRCAFVYPSPRGDELQRYGKLYLGITHWYPSPRGDELQRAKKAGYLAAYCTYPSPRGDELQHNFHRKVADAGVSVPAWG